MKSNLVINVLKRYVYILVLLLVFSSCSEEEDLFVESQNTSLKSDIFRSGDTSGLSNAVELTGSFYFLTSNTSNETILYTRTSDEVYFFICFDCESFANEKVIEKKEGKITFLDHAFIFQSGSEKFYFYVDNKYHEKMADNFKVDKDKSKTYKGGGIGFKKLNLTDDIHRSEKLSNENIVSSINKFDAFEEIYHSFNIRQKSSGCESGGVGSSSCSISDGTNSCSVSCDPGFYACCGGVCICVVNEQIEPDPK